MKFFKKAAALALALCMSLSGIGVLGVTSLADDTTAEFTTIGGWYETAFATWPDSDALSATIYYKKTGDSEYKQLNSSSDLVTSSDNSTGKLSIYDGTNYIDAYGYKNCVVRQSSSNIGRVDIMGIGWGNFDIKVVASDNTTTYEKTVTILQEDRSGYAHFNTSSNYVGAYNDDGTLDDNALIVYVTNDNKNTVKWSGYSSDTGIGSIAGHIYKYRENSSNPVIIRFLGTVDTTAWEKSESPSTYTYEISETSGKQADSEYADTTNSGVRINNLSSKFTLLSGETYSITTIDGSTVYTVSTTSDETDTDTTLNMMSFKDSSGNNGANKYLSRLTIEGVGTDSTAKNWGMNITYGNGVEVKNMHFVSAHEDACSAESSNNIWVHRCTFEVGANRCDLTKEQDKHEGDGTTDFNKDNYVTSSYNIYNNAHKTSLNGGSDSAQQFNYTYHHNFFNECSSRLPLTRFVNVHMYNNYTYSASKAISARSSAFVFSENNYYDSTKNVFVTNDGDYSTYGYGNIKSYGDTFTACEYVSTYNDANTILTASNRNDAITIGSNNQHTANTYSDAYINNFDTDSTNFYYKNGATNVSYLTTAEEAKAYVTAESGVLKDGTVYTDIMGTASYDDDVDNDDNDGYTTITDEQTLNSSNLSTSAYFKNNGDGTSSTNVYVPTSSTYIRITSSGTISFKVVEGATVTVNAKNPTKASADGSTQADRILTLKKDSEEIGSYTYAYGGDYEDYIFGSNLAAGIYTVSSNNNLNISYIKVTFDATEEETETTTDSYIIYDKAVLELTTDVTYTEDTVLSDHFTILADSSTYVIDANNKTFDNNFKYAYRLKSGGVTTYTDNIPTARAIKFETAGPATLQIRAMSAKSGETRTVYVLDSLGKGSGSTISSVYSYDVDGSSTVSSPLISLPEAGTYYIAFSGGINVYSAVVVVGGLSEINNGIVIGDKNTDSSYIVTGITENQFEGNAPMTITVQANGYEGTATDETSTVYTMAVIDDLAIKPSDLGTSYSYLYGVMIKESGGTTALSITEKKFGSN